MTATKREEQIERLLICQKDVTHIWGEMPFIQKCCECSGELVWYVKESRAKVLVEALKIISFTDRQDKNWDGYGAPMLLDIIKHIVSIADKALQSLEGE